MDRCSNIPDNQRRLPDRYVIQDHCSPISSWPARRQLALARPWPEPQILQCPLGQAADEDTVGGEVKWSQLGMGFEKETILIERHFKVSSQLFGSRGHNGGGQIDKIRLQYYWTAQNMIHNFNL